MSVQARYLHDDTIMRQTIYKRIRKTLCHLVPFIIEGIMFYIQYRLLDVTYTMTQQIDCYHWNSHAVSILLFQHIVRIGILSSQILTESQGFRFKPSLLQFYQHQMKTTISITNFSSKVYTKHRNLIALHIGIFMLTQFHLNDRLL